MSLRSSRDYLDHFGVMGNSMTAPNSTFTGSADTLALDPCPFCGSAILHVTSLARSFDPPRLFHEWHHCDDNEDACPIRRNGKIVASTNDSLESQAAVVQRWNARSFHPAQGQSERGEPVAWIVKWVTKHTPKNASAYLNEADAKRAAANVKMYADASEVEVIPTYAAPQPTTAAKGDVWEPVDFWKFVSGLAGEFEADQMRDMLAQRGLQIVGIRDDAYCLSDCGAKAYVERAIASYEGDPADNQFQKGFLAALEVVRDEAFALSSTDGCARCGHPRAEHSYNGACYGLCGEFVPPVSPADRVTEAGGRSDG